MRILATFSDGYCGSDEELALIFPNGTPARKIDEYLYEELSQYMDSHETDVGEPEDYDTEEDYELAHENWVSDSGFDWFEVDEDSDIIDDYTWEEVITLYE